MTDTDPGREPAAGPKSGIGRIGIWSMELRFGDPMQAADATRELDDLGYGAIWIPGGIGGDLLGDVGRLLAAAPRLTIATGILNIYKHKPADVGAWWQARSAAEQARLMLGLGVSHAALIGQDYAKPLATMSAYLDGLDAAGLPPARRCIAALGPKMLDLARTRSAGSHPYLVTPEHTASARERLGPDPLLAPEQGVILESDPDAARAIARAGLAHYLHLPNYINSWRRQGFSDEDIGGASDRLIDRLFAWGSPERIAARVHDHLAAGADHVCLQVLHEGAATQTPPRAAWRTLAAALL